MGHPWPLFDLRLRTPRLELRLPTDDDLLALAAVARAGVHDLPGTPFLVPWDELPSPAFERQFLLHWWQVRGSWSPGDWTLGLAVLAEGRPIGIQDLMAQGLRAPAHRGHGQLARPRAPGPGLRHGDARRGPLAGLRGARRAGRRVRLRGRQRGVREGVRASSATSPNGERLIAPTGTAGHGARGPGDAGDAGAGTWSPSRSRAWSRAAACSASRTSRPRPGRRSDASGPPDDDDGPHGPHANAALAAYPQRA